MRINLLPNVANPENGGVLQVAYHLRKALEELGHEISDEGLTHGHAFEASDEVYTSHGIYPQPNPLNRKLFNNLCRAQIVTAVSKWTAKQISPIRKDVIVIPNGIDLASLRRVTKHSGDYILWAKNNADETRNPQAFIELAKNNPTLRFVMTVAPGKVPKNVEVIGLQPYDRMLEFLAGARLYVSTGTENFPIQVLEAMALGTPVLALPKGGVAEIPGIYLAEDGQTGLGYCLTHSAELVQKQSSEIEFYDWKNIAKRYVEVYQKIRPSPPPKVSVVIPVYNYAKSVGRAIDSVLTQNQKADEIIVVDDGSTDGLSKALKPYKGKIKVIRQRNNAGVASARNRGISDAKGDFICCLDADDELSTNFIAETYKILNTDRGLGIAYPSLSVNIDDRYNTLPLMPFDFDKLVKDNFIPCANLFRKQAWERAGGYKNINPSWEDYDLWLSITELGYEAKEVSGASLGYTVHDSGRSAQEQRGNFSQLLRATVDGYHKRLYDNKGWVTFIIPCYEQWQYVEEAIESVFKQTYPHVKAIIVDDASPNIPGKDYLDNLVKKYPKLGICCRQTNGGLSAARNTGIRQADSKWVVLLDADDKIHPDFLAECLKVGYDSDKYIYTDTLTWHANGTTEPMDMPDFDCDNLIKGHQHPCTIFIQKKWIEDIGGYDEQMKQGWEDYELVIRLVKANHAGQRVPKRLFYYRWRKNSMRQRAELVKKDINAYIWAKHSDVAKKGFATMCCGNRRVNAPIYQDKNAANNIPVPDGFVLIEYGGAKVGQMTKQGGKGRVYKYSAEQRYFPVHKNDLSLFGVHFRQIIKNKPQVEIAKPVPIADPVAAMPEGDEDLTVIEGITPELQTIIKEAGITTKLKLVAATQKKIFELVGDRKLAKSIQVAAIELSRANVLF